MHRAWPVFRAYVHCLAKHAGGRLWLSLTLLIGVGLLEGSGLLLLLPLLQLIGLGEVSGAGGIGQAAASVLRRTHIPLTLAGVLAVFVAIMAVQAWLRVCLDVLNTCLLYTSDAADEEDSVDLGGR